MKKSICLAVCLLALMLTPVFGQPAPTPPKPLPAPQLPPPASEHFQQRLQTIVERANPPANQPSLTKFNLDFSGGTPAQLVKAIEKATGKPLNAIISVEDADAQLPPLKMNNVDVGQLFQALEAASRKVVSVAGPYSGTTSQQQIGYSFKTASGTLSDDSIWYFHVERPSLPPAVSTEKICRFYQLTYFLDHGFTVDDITTAIQTGWKMSGIASPPELNYHKETKLLIAFGEPNQLSIISSVLQSLPEANITHTMIGDVRDMKYDIQQLHSQVDKLTKKISTLTPPPAALPAEKSGK